MRISFTRFSTYQTCPQQYKLQYVDRIPVPTHPQLLFGAAIHEALRFMYDARHLHTPTLEQVIEAFRAAWQARQQEVAEDLWKAYFEHGVDALRRHYETATPGEEGRSVAATELVFNIPLDGGHKLSGRIDRIDVLPGNRLEIIDYKTDRTMPTQEMAERDAQLAIYRMAADHLYPGHQVTTVFLYVLHNFALRVTHSEEFLAQTRAAICEAIARIQLGEFDPRPDRHCDWCNYRSYCPVWREAVPPEEMKDVDIGELLRKYGELDAQAREMRQQLAQLKDQINAYLDACQAERVEGGGYVAFRRPQTRLTWDEAKVRAVLEPAGLWEAVSSVNSAAVRDLLRSGRLTLEQKLALEAAAERKVTSTLYIRRVAGVEEGEEEENDS